MGFRHARHALAFALALAWAGTALGQTPQPGPATASPAPVAAPSDPAARRQAEQEAAWDAANKVAKIGPEDIPLAGQGSLALPEGYAFIPQPEAGRLEQSFGNGRSSTLVGLVFPVGDGDWYVSIDYNKEGYIREDDAKDWNADELLTSLKDGTEEGNAERVARGFKPLQVTGWIEPPKYDTQTHRLVWSAKVVDKGDPTDEGSANYNTYALGRDGYFSLDLIASTSTVEADKKFAHALLDGISYIPGKRYADFNESTDRVAEYGLAALVAGVAAKKLGLIAIIGAFLLKFAKVIVIALGAVGFSVAKLFRRKPRDGNTA